MTDGQKFSPCAGELAVGRELAYNQNKGHCPTSEVHRRLGRSLSFEDWLKPACISAAASHQSLKLSSSQHPISAPVHAAASKDWLGTRKLPPENFVAGESSNCKVPPPPPLKVPYRIGMGTPRHDERVETPAPCPSPVPDLSSRTIAAPSHQSHYINQIQNTKEKQIRERILLPTRYSSWQRKATPAGSKNIDFLQRPKSALPSDLCASKYLTNVKGGSLFCEDCQVMCSSPFNLKQHLKGRQHKSKLQFRKPTSNSTTNGGKTSSTQVQKERCDICMIWCKNTHAMNKHLKGKIHQARLQETEFCQHN